MKQPVSAVSSLVLLSISYLITFSVFYMGWTREFEPVAELTQLRFAIFCLLLPIIIKYVMQLFASALYSTVEKLREKNGAPVENPSVSVLIPAWNEEVGILKTIVSVLNTQYPNLEVIIINDGSTDGTHGLVTQFLDDYSRQEFQQASIQYLNVENGGKAKALNHALAHAGGDIIVTIDADSVMDACAITQLVRRFNTPKVAAVAGNVIVGNRKKPIELMQQLEYLYGFFFKRADSTFSAVYIIGGAAAAYRKEVLLRLGGFDHNIITEDIEMSTRILAHGYSTRYAADAVIYTEGPSDIKGLCNQRLRWKFGRMLTFFKHRKLFFSLKAEHSRYLAWLTLPLAVYAEVILLFEGFMLAVFYGYTIYANDYYPLIFVILLLTSVVCLQVVFDAKSRFQRNLLLLAPIAWLVFHVMDAVEFQALFRAIKRFVKREDLQWQKWVRVGVPQQKACQTDMVSASELTNELV